MCIPEVWPYICKTVQHIIYFHILCYFNEIFSFDLKHTHTYASTEIFQICTGSAFCLSQKMLHVWMLHRQNAKKKRRSKNWMFSCFLCCVHSTNIEHVGGIGSNYGRYEEMEWVSNWIKRWHMEWCVRGVPYPFCQKWNSKMMTNIWMGHHIVFVQQIIIPKALWQLLKPHTNTNFTMEANAHVCMCVCLSVLPEPVKNNNKTNAFRLMKRVHICDASTLYLWIRFCFLSCPAYRTNVFLPAQTHIISMVWIFSVHSLIFSVNSIHFSISIEKRKQMRMTVDTLCVPFFIYANGGNSTAQRLTKTKTHIFSTTMG